MESPAVEHDEARCRFITRIDDREAYLAYTLRDDDAVEFLTVFVPSDARNQGLAEVITRRAFAWAADRGLPVIPVCSYVRRLADADPDLRTAIRP